MFEEISRKETAEFKRDDPSPALPEQDAAISVYRDGSGAIVIRQRRPVANEDSCVVVPREAAENLVKAIRREVQAATE
jgi:hypothetical protein